MFPKCLKGERKTRRKTDLGVCAEDTPDGRELGGEEREEGETRASSGGVMYTRCVGGKELNLRTMQNSKMKRATPDCA